jgi:DNA invertase Pin-like site-specific DNA recombinase
MADDSLSMNPAFSKRTALYARVSTKQHGQNPETQLLPLRDFVQARGFTIVDEYIDVGISGAKSSRPQLDRMMADARKRKFDAVLVARFDRFARSVKHLVTALEEFNALGVDFISLNESIDTSTPMGKMVFTILGAVAELERSLIRERVQAGVDRAKRQKKQLGRPKVVVDREKIRHCALQGQSVKSIAKQFGIGRATVDRILGKGCPKPLGARPK